MMDIEYLTSCPMTPVAWITFTNDPDNTHVKCHLMITHDPIITILSQFSSGSSDI